MSKESAFKCERCGRKWHARVYTFDGREYPLPWDARCNCHKDAYGVPALPLDFDCPTCGSEEGVPCTRRGSVLRRAHPERGAPRRFPPYRWGRSGAKLKRRKPVGHYLRSVIPWEGSGKESRTRANRKERHRQQRALRDFSKDL